MSVIDFHTHVWPPAIAPRAVATITEFPIRGDGTVTDLARVQQESGITASVCLFFALSPERVESVNTFAGSLHSDNIIPFGTIHPELTPEENLASLQRSGVRGIKVHPTFQNYRLDDRRLLETLDAVSSHYPAVFHVGAGAGGDGSGATPQMILDIRRQIPGLTMIAAHFGGFRMWEQARSVLAGSDVFVDTSWPPSLAGVRPELVLRAAREHGIERIVFGSDWPTAHPGDELAALRKVGFSSDELERIEHLNARGILDRSGEVRMPDQGVR
jgi:uncharacterized protein